MAGTMIPYAPLDVLKSVAPNVWIVDGAIIHFRMGPIEAPFPTRMTIVRLPNGTLWLHSPIELNEKIARLVRELGPVASLVSPNPIHYWWLADWKAEFPDAEVYAVRQLADKAKRPVPPYHRLTSTPPEQWQGKFDQLLVEDGWFSETVFFHRPSRTLILADLIENFELPRVSSFWNRLLLRFGGVADPHGSMPRDMRWAFRKRRAALRHAVEQMIAWNPERVILAHGRWYEKNGAAELARAFQWLL